VAVGESCRSADAHTAICTAAPGVESIPRFVAQLGDGDDTLGISGGLGVRTKLDGRPATTRSTGGEEDDTLDGGPAPTGSRAARRHAQLRRPGGARDRRSRRRSTSDGDTLRGIERVEGGEGRDRLLGGPARTRCWRRPGTTSSRPRRAGHAQRRARRRPARRRRGEDTLRGDPPQGDDYYTPRIRLRPDVLRGGPGDDTLSDSGGANRLEGGSGDDLLEGGSGPDRIDGGSGADWLTATAGRTGSPGAPGGTRCGAAAGPIGSPAARGSTACSAARARTGCGPATAPRTAPIAATAAIAPRSTRKTACTLANGCGAVSILLDVDQAFPHSSAAHSLTPRRTEIA
jgi:Ca2+-binding RTX toxin-like protein